MERIARTDGRIISNNFVTYSHFYINQPHCDCESLNFFLTTRPRPLSLIYCGRLVFKSGHQYSSLNWQIFSWNGLDGEQTRLKWSRLVSSCRDANEQWLVYLAPIRDGHAPFFADVHRCESMRILAYISTLSASIRICRIHMVIPSTNPVCLFQ